MTKILNLLNVLVIFSALIAVQSRAKEQPILTFSQWKNQQITESENRVIRLANQLTTERSKEDESIDESHLTDRIETELRIAQHNVGLAHDFVIDDYFNNYLSKYSDDEKSLLAVARTMSKNEIAQLLRLFLRSHNSAAQFVSPQSPMANSLIKDDKDI